MKHRKTAKGRESELLRGKRYRQKYPEKVKQSHNLRRLKKYGLNVESYNKIFAQQEGKCAICGIHQSELNKSLSVDHCHVSGKIRGLLCTYCNRLLVAYIDKAKPSLKTLQRAIQYIKEQE
ncbi:MAG: endonuclease VII domain-containing protein [Planctomycetes bacterium]|nr:endonuclease VII domain-containing protein [Planctomycetota bacterium]